MIDQTDLLSVMGKAIAASGLFPRVAYPNKDTAPEKPYLAVSLVPMTITDDTLGQSYPVWTGKLFCTVVTDLGGFDTEAQGLAKSLAELFPSTTKLTLTNGQKVRVSGWPTPATSYRDNSDFRLQVSIPLRSDTI